MIDYSKIIKTALLTACPRVYSDYPDTFNQTPVISFYEAANSGDDTRDLLTPLAYQVDVWALKTGDLKSTVAAVDMAIRTLGFRRALSREVPDPSGYKHQTMRFEGVYNALEHKLYPRS